HQRCDAACHVRARPRHLVGGEPDVVQPGDQAIDGDAGLGLCEGMTDAVVAAKAQTDVLVRSTADVELVGAVEDVRITVGGPYDNDHGVATADPLGADADALAGAPRPGACG